MYDIEEKRRYCSMEQAAVALTLVQKSFRKRLWTSRKADCVNNERLL